MSTTFLPTTMHACCSGRSAADSLPPRLPDARHTAWVPVFGRRPAFRVHAAGPEACRAIRCAVAASRQQHEPDASAEDDDDVAVSEADAQRLDSMAEQLISRMQELETDFATGRWDDLDGIDMSDSTEDDSAAEASRVRPARRGAKGRAPKQLPLSALPKVAVVGRPNVGKSALFNRLTKSALAIVYDYPGVTRDRLYTRGFWGDRDFCIVDTGGLTSDAETLARGQYPEHFTLAEQLPSAIEKQAAAAIAEADAIIVVTDGQTGIAGADEDIVNWLRRHHADKHTVLAVNKCENTAKADIQASEFWNLGLEPFPVSAISGTGTGELMDALMSGVPMPKAANVAVEDAALAVAIIGRPNVGKSSLLNAICGEERSIVSPISGTTRDAIDTDVALPDGRVLTLIDTAGIRRRTAVASSPDGAEPLSVDRAFRAVRRADVVVFVLDALEGVSQQDFRLAEVVAAEGRACVLVINKWDAVAGKTGKTLEDTKADVLAQLRPLEWASVVFTSAKTGQRVERVLDAVLAAGAQHRHRVATATINMVVGEASGWRPPPTARGSGRKGRIYYATQAATRPPAFVMFVNDPKLFTDDYKRYIERQLRINIGFPGTPIRIFWRGKANTLRAGGKPSGKASRS